jgi:protein gp37
MSDNSAIEWCDATWNPTTGCTKITTGCDRCYAARFAERFRNVPGHPYEPGFDLTLRPERLKQPLSWKRPRMIFVDSMSDLFHKDIPTAYIDKVFDTMEEAEWHRFQVITKRSSLMRDCARERYGRHSAPAHIWLGVSVEEATSKSRIEHLRATPAAVRFLSIEPMLGPLGAVDFTGIHWLLLGGETGPGARPLDIAWVREIRDQCVAKSVAFYFKRWGGPRPKTSGMSLDGREWKEFPHMPIAVKAAA